MVKAPGGSSRCYGMVYFTNEERCTYLEKCRFERWQPDPIHVHSMLTEDQLNAYILTGGSSRRFGSDKAVCMINGTSFIDKILTHFKVILFIHILWEKNHIQVKWSFSRIFQIVRLPWWGSLLHSGIHLHHGILLSAWIRPILLQM